MKLYHYVHCPFCVRVRMACGFLNIDYDSFVLPYDDEKTPLDLTGKKMLPIAEIKGEVLNESLDIIKTLDTSNQLQNELFNTEFNSLLDQIGKSVHSLAMPYWIWTPEFDENSRAYFQNKKELKRGPFKDLVLKSDNFVITINSLLEKSIQNELKPFFKGSSLSILDICLASHLWGLYIVPEYQFPDVIHRYLQSVKKECKFFYHKDFWR